MVSGTEIRLPNASLNAVYLPLLNAVAMIDREFVDRAVAPKI